MVGNRRETWESTSQTSVKWRKPAGDGTPFLVIQAIGKKSSLRLTCISRLEKATWKIGTGSQPRIAVHQSADFPPFARDARSRVSPHSLPLAFPPPAPVGSAPAVSTLNTTPTPGMVTVSWTPRCSSPPHRCCSKGSWLVWPAVWGSGFGAEVVGASGGKPGPLGGRAAVQPHLVTFGIPPLRPALGRVLPELLPAVGGQIQESVRRCHHFIAAAGGPVGLEDLVTVSEIADQDAEVPVCDQLVHGILRHRVPGNGPAHEVAIARALLVRSLTEGELALS